MAKYFVAGDIGGTNARLQLFSHQVLRRRSELIFEKFYASGRYPSLTVILELFLREADHETAWNVSNENWPVYACLAVAGPVYNNECSFTNIPSWPRLVGKDMARDLNIPEVALINDFLAVAFGILKLTPGDYTQLNPGKEPLERAPISCVGAGTGLGMCYLTWSESAYCAWGSEGGHTDFAPQTEEHWRLRSFTQQELGVSHISVERFVSGPGLPLIYKFILRDRQEQAKQPDEMAMALQIQQSEASMQSKMICQLAKENKESLPAQALYLLVELFGAEAGNMALKTFSFGSCYLSGSVAPKNLWAFEENDRFMNAFLGKGRMKSNRTMELFPVRIIHAGVEVGLLGTQQYCEQELARMERKLGRLEHIKRRHQILIGAVAGLALSHWVLSRNISARDGLLSFLGSFFGSASKS